MCSEIAISNKNTHHVKVINILRVVIYVYAIMSQVFWEWVNNPSGVSIDPLIVLVPMVLAIADLLLVFWSNSNPRKFWNILPFVSVLAILVSINTIWTTVSIGRWYSPHADLFGLSLVVVFASFYEIILWIERNQLIIKGLEDSRSDEIRTYDS